MPRPAHALTTKAEVIFRLPEVQQYTGFSRSHIYGLMAAGAFPRQVKIGVRAVGWRESDIVAWQRRQGLSRSPGKPSESPKEAQPAAGA